jgi:hypothetical protein
MKRVADWIRNQTPTWTDAERYETITFYHRLLGPGTVAGFVFGGPIIRACILVLHSLVIVTQIAYRDCLLRRVEREFSSKKMKTNKEFFLQAIGLDTLSPIEKMMFTAGLNTGMLIMFVIILLQKSVLWTVVFAGVVFTVPTILWWYSTVLPPLETSSQLPRNALASLTGQSSSQTPSPAVAYTGSTGETESDENSQE